MAYSAKTIIQQLDRVTAEIERLRSLVDGLNDRRPTEVTALWVREVQNARRRRSTIIGDQYFADPAWDLLLELFAVHLLNERRAVTEVWRAAGIPGTTALRWISQLEEAGLVERSADPADKRKLVLQLTDSGAAAMETYFRDELPRGITA